MITLLEGGEGVNVTDCREDEIFEFHMSNAQFETFRPQNVCICLNTGRLCPGGSGGGCGRLCSAGTKDRGKQFFTFPVRYLPVSADM